MPQHTTLCHGKYLVLVFLCSPAIKSASIANDRGGIALLTADTDPASAGATVDWTILARLPSTQTSKRAHSDIVRCIEWDGTVSIY